MKIAVIGNGFLAHAFRLAGHTIISDLRLCPVDDPEHMCLQVEERFDELDIADADAVVNCVGRADTRWNEDPVNAEEAMFVNGEIPRILSYACRTKNKRFVHISTGCLYDDESRLVPEDSFLAAHCFYVVTKWIAEQQLDPTRDLIIRPRLLFADYPNKFNQVQKLQTFDKLLNVENSYTSNHVIVEAVEALLNANQRGPFNVACEKSLTAGELGQLTGPLRPALTSKELRDGQKIHLVNNVMDLSKLKQFYQPPKLKDEWLRCYNKLVEEGHIVG